MLVEEMDGVKEFILERLGKRCVDCGEVIMIQSELSIKSCDPTCVKCEKEFNY